MRPYERRETNAYPYFKLAVWDDRNCVWRAGKRVMETESAARSLARAPGRYRIERFHEKDNEAMEPFDVAG